MTSKPRRLFGLPTSSPVFSFALPSRQVLGSFTAWRLRRSTCHGRARSPGYLSRKHGACFPPSASLIPPLTRGGRLRAAKKARCGGDDFLLDEEPGGAVEV